MKSYQKIYGDYKKEVADILEGYVIIEEKVDGSQFRIEIDDQGRILCGSHHQELNLVDSSFKKGTDEAQVVFKGLEADPSDTITIFAEYLSKPKQNTIPYERVPKHNFVVFDVIINGKYLDREEKERFAFSVDLECVPMLWRGEGKDFTDEVRNKLLKSKSFLGHQPGYDKVEGIVIKNYQKWFDMEKYPWLEGMWMAAKIVNEEFKEKNAITSPAKGDVIDAIKKAVCSEARWRKAVQHLREKDELKFDMVDMAKLAPEIVRDLEDEEKEAIKDQLWKLYGKSILQASVRGLPIWYKDYLREENKIG